MLGAGGFDADGDIAAITVNRWGHGYSYSSSTLFDGDEDPEPFEVARRRFGNVSFSEAAFCEPLACVVFGQDRARIDIGSEVLIIGAGPIGQLHLQASRANGAASVTMVDVVVTGVSGRVEMAEALRRFAGLAGKTGEGHEAAMPRAAE